MNFWKFITKLFGIDKLSGNNRQSSRQSDNDDTYPDELDYQQYYSRQRISDATYCRWNDRQSYNPPSKTTGSHSSWSNSHSSWDDDHYAHEDYYHDQADDYAHDFDDFDDDY